MRAAAALLALLPLFGCKDPNHFAAPPPPKVTVAAPTQQKITRYLELTGNSAPLNTVDLVARVQGFLQDISYVDGTSVKKGDILFTIEPLPYQAKLQQAQAAESGANAQLKNAETNYTRQLALQRQDVNSQKDLDNALAQRDSDQATLVQAQADTQIAAINYSYTRVLAPFDGVMSAHMVSVGELVGTSPTTLATIVQQRPIYVNFSVNESDVLRIRAGMVERGLTAADLDKIPVEVGLQSETGYPHIGHIDYVAPQVNVATGTLAVRGILDNADRLLLPGYFVRVRVPVQRNVDAILVPTVSVGADQGGPYVLVVGADNVVQQHHVTAGAVYGDLRVIENGLKPDERVVVSGVQYAVPGQKVEPQQRTALASP